METVRFEKVVKVYSNLMGRVVTRALDGISFTLEQGKILSVLGPNGAGKSTMIKIMAGVVEPTSGHVKIGGFDVTRERRRAQSRLGVVLGDSRALYWRLTVKENLEYFGILRNPNGIRALREQVGHLLRLFELYDVRYRPAGELSKGMRQRVACAVGLLGEPDVIVMDEPTAGLDVYATKSLIDLLKVVAREEGKSVILATHQMSVAQAISDIVCIISGGKILAYEELGRLLSLFSIREYEIRIDGDGLTKDDIGPMGHLGSLGGRMRIPDDGSRIIIDFDGADNHEVFYQLIDLLRARGKPILSILRREPTLEEVFTRLTGRGGGSGLSRNMVGRSQEGPLEPATISSSDGY